MMKWLYAFLSAEDVGLKPLAKLGDGYITNSDPRNVLSVLRTHPPYKMPLDGKGQTAIRIGVLNLIGDNPQIPKYLDQIRQQFRAIRIDVSFTGAARPQPGLLNTLHSGISQLVADS